MLVNVTGSFAKLTLEVSTLLYFIELILSLFEMINNEHIKIQIMQECYENHNLDYRT